MLYSDKVLAYFHNLEHAGFDSISLERGYLGEAGVIANGDRVQLWLLIEADCISQVRYHVYGSVATMACAEFLACKLEGCSLLDAKLWTGERVLGELQLPQIKMNSVIIVTTAVERALQQHA